MGTFSADQPKKCAWCNNLMYGYDYLVMPNGARVCSQKCASEYEQRFINDNVRDLDIETIVGCTSCQKEFSKLNGYYVLTGSDTKYCSKPCLKKAYDFNLQAAERFMKCVWCGEKLNIFSQPYYKAWDYNLPDINVKLCSVKCKKEVLEFLTDLSKKNNLSLDIYNMGVNTSVSPCGPEFGCYYHGKGGLPTVFKESI